MGPSLDDVWLAKRFLTIIYSIEYKFNNHLYKKKGNFVRCFAARRLG